LALFYQAKLNQYTISGDSLKEIGKDDKE